MSFFLFKDSFAKECLFAKEPLKLCCLDTVVGLDFCFILVKLTAFIPVLQYII